VNEARVYKFPTLGNGQEAEPSHLALPGTPTVRPLPRTSISQIVSAGRREDAQHLRREARLVSGVARSACESAASLGTDAETDGHAEAARHLKLAALRLKQAERELKRGHDLIPPDGQPIA
jgi:hypothetical protein